jgi:hypothetical protein
MVTTILLDTLKRLAPKPPPAIKTLAGIKIK